LIIVLVVKKSGGKQEQAKSVEKSSEKK